MKKSVEMAGMGRWSTSNGAASPFSLECDQRDCFGAPKLVRQSLKSINCSR
jgi:hypothetical protein